MFDMTRIFPHRQLFAGLAEMGRHDWLTFERDGEGRTPGVSLNEDVNQRLIDASKAVVDVWHWFGDLLEGYGSADLINLMPYWHVARVLAVGPKVIRPSAAACRVLATMAIDIANDDYALPYDAMIVALPVDWVAEVCAAAGIGPGGVAPPAFAILSHRRGFGAISLIMASARGLRNGEPIDYLATASTKITIEDAISESRARDEIAAGYAGGLDLARARASTTIYRAVLNLGLMMTYAGVKSRGWLDPAGHAKHEKLARRDARGRALLAGDVEEVDFVQDVHHLLGIDVRDRGEYRGGTHAAPHPHWRRRHWYMKAYGPGRSQRKLDIRRGTFVRARALPAGVSPEDIQANYDVELPGPDDGRPEGD